jgi:AcrR family transcriptional regulator
VPTPKQRTTSKELSGLGLRRVHAKTSGSADYEQRRRDIIEAAGRVVRRKGLQRTTIGDIAAACGGDRDSIYYYFHDKAEIFQGAIRDALSDLVSGFEDLLERDLDPAERLHEALRFSMATYERHYPYLYLFFQETDYLSARAPELTGDLVKLGERYEAMLRQALKEGVESGEFALILSEGVVGNLVLGMLNWTHRWYQPDGEFSATEIADAMWHLISGGLLGSASTPGPVRRRFSGGR